MIYDPKSFELLDYFLMDSVVKSLDVNRNNNIIMGLKSGEIKMKFLNLRKTPKTIKINVI